MAVRPTFYFFELCATEVGAVRAAHAAGADRVELCIHLEEGGITPPVEMIEAARQAAPIPLHILIRPHSRDFFYSDEEFAQMRREVLMAQQAGAAGVVLGLLRNDGRIDTVRTRALVELARPLRVTFHRAFDVATDPSTALEEVIATGADELLTSGGAPHVDAGAAQLRKLQQQAGQRIQILAGGGLRLNSLHSLLQRSGVRRLHGSLGGLATCADHDSQNEAEAALAERIRTVLDILHTESQTDWPSVSACALKTS